MTSLISRALVSGAVAGAATTLTAAWAGRRAAGSSAAPLNATSHFLWGERAGRENRYSLKYTALGLVTNFGASIFWALFYEGLGRRRHRRPLRAIADGAAVSAAAYIVDYQLVPRRLTPGFELRLPGKALAAVFGALALGLSARDLLAPQATRAPGGRRAVRTMRRYPAAGQRDIMKQAREDLQHGLEDTDCRGVAPAEHCPTPGAKRD